MFMIGFKDNEIGGSSSEILKREIVTNCLLRTLFGKSSSFYKKLYDCSVINKTFCSFYEYEDSCAYAAFFGESENIDALEKEIYSEIAKAKTAGIDKDAFERAKKVMCGQFMATLDSIESFGNEYMMCYHKGVNLFDYVSICENLTVEDAMERLCKLLNKEQCSVSVVFPKKG